MPNMRFDDVIVTNFDQREPYRPGSSRSLRSQSCHGQPNHTLHRPQMRPYNGEISIIDLTSDTETPSQEVTVIRPDGTFTPETRKKSLSKYLRMHRTSVASCPSSEAQYKDRLQNKSQHTDNHCYSSGDERIIRRPEFSLNSSQVRRSIRNKKGSLDSQDSQDSLESLQSRDLKTIKSAKSEASLYTNESIDSAYFAARNKRAPYIEILSEEGTMQQYGVDSRRTSVTNTEYYDLLCKVVLLGDSGVGKTCLLMKYKDGTFLSGAYISTVGIDFRNKVVSVEGSKVKLQIWDTAGQERFRSVTHAYYRDAHALLLLYDVSSKTSFDNTRAWLAEVHEYAQDDVVIMLIGNKCDVAASERQIRKEDGERLAREYNVAFAETSAKTGINVDLAFTAIARDLKSRKSVDRRDKHFNVAEYVRQEATPECACNIG